MKEEVEEITMDEMWSYVGARKGKKRNSVYIWTACIKTKDNKKIVTFYVGKRDEESFIKFFGSLPIAKKYYSDDYKVY